jgi:hypothetical protein
MNNAAKLRRIVLLRAGRIEHGDIEIDGSVQLYGTNNRGKTSVISSIRFLFIPRVEEMGFHYKVAETKAYYFGDESSAMIFECLSASNRLVTVVAWHNGSLGKHDFDRYIYNGGYQQSDFFDEEGDSRPHTEVLGLLSGKGVRKLEPRWVPNVITGITGEAPPDLPLIGLAPVKNINDYDRFIVLFRNLLNLTKLSQQNIKDTFVAINRQMLSRTELYVHKESADHFAREAVERNAIETLNSSAINIQNATEAAEIWRSGRKRLPSMYARLNQARLARKLELEELAKRAEDDINTMGTEIQDLGGQILDAQAKQGVINQNKGVVDNNIKQHQQNTDTNRWPEYDSELQLGVIQNLEAEIADLHGRIGVAQLEPVAVVKHRLETLKLELDRKKENLAKFSSLLGTKLREAMSEDDLINAGRLINPSVFSLAVGTEATITDGVALRSAVLRAAEIASKGDGGALGIKFDPNYLANDADSRFRNIEELQASINKLTGLIAITAEQLAAAEEIAGLKEKAKNDGVTLEATRTKRRLYLEWENNQINNLPEWKKRATAIMKELEAANAALDKLQGSKKAKEEERQDIHNVLLKNTRPELERCSVLKATRPNWERWETEADDSTLGDFGTKGRFEDMLAQYEDEYATAIEKRDQFDSLIIQLRQATVGTYDKPTNEETIAAMNEALESLDERRRVHEKIIHDLVTALRSGASHMHESLNTLEAEIRRFNTKFSASLISDLRSVNIEMFRIDREVASLKSILSISDDMFADPRKIEDIRAILSSKSYFNMVDLFGIQFITEDGAGKKMKVDDLQSNVGSTGTTITIKVMFCVMLLRGLLKPKAEIALPFFIDEVNALDPNNLRAVMQIAKEQGFTPILASPQAVGAARNIYHVQDIGDGLSTIPPNSRIGRNDKSQLDLVDG